LKKIPLRKCIGCNTSKPKKELIRIVKNKDAEINIDETSKLNGRGAYICNSIECFEKLVKSRGLEREFEQKIESLKYEEIKNYINNKQCK